MALGCLAGVALGYGALEAANDMAAGLAGRRAAVWRFQPSVLLGAFLLSQVTVLLAAWAPARKLGRTPPLCAIRYAGEPTVKRSARFALAYRLFGVEGELAGNALRAHRKALRTSALSLTLAFLGFTLMLCFFTLADISTRHTYFERYQGVWDVMLTLRNTDIAQVDSLAAVRAVKGVKDAAMYQKATAYMALPGDGFSGALSALGGPGALSGGAVVRQGESWLLHAPLLILDDEAFLAYCARAGAEGRLDGAIVLNRAWDSVHSGFRYREYVPYLNEERRTLSLQTAGVTDGLGLPVLAYTAQPPLLREEYPDYALALFLPLSLWRDVSASIDATEPDTVIRLLAAGDPSPEELDRIERATIQALGAGNAVESENRLREKQTNDDMLRGYKLALGGLCVLLAVIGVANVFTYALTFLQQRRRELAQYRSLGMTPGGMRKMFFVEALMIAGRPLLIALPLAAVAVGVMIRMSALNPAEFLWQAPWLPVAAFCLAIFGCVGLAYALGGRLALRDDLAEALQG